MFDLMPIMLVVQHLAQSAAQAAAWRERLQETVRTGERFVVDDEQYGLSEGARICRSLGVPELDADGEVVGILNGGNIHFTLPKEVWAGYMGAIRDAQEKIIKEAESIASGQQLTKDQQQALEQKVAATLKALQNTPLPVADLQRAPSAALINFGQRIDMLSELMQMVEAAKKKGDL